MFLLIASSVNEARWSVASVDGAQPPPGCSRERAPIARLIVRHTRAPRARTASPKTPLDRLLRRAGRAPPSTAPLPSSSDGTPWTLGRACRRSTHPDGSVAEIAM